MKIHGQERNRSFLFLQTKEEKKATRTKGTFKPLEILMASEKQYRSIEVSVCMFSLAQYTHYTHIPLEEMNMHKIASFQVSSCFFLLLSVSFATSALLILRCSLYVRFVSKSFVCRLPFRIFVTLSRLHMQLA